MFAALSNANQKIFSGGIQYVFSNVVMDDAMLSAVVDCICCRHTNFSTAFPSIKNLKHNASSFRTLKSVDSSASKAITGEARMFVRMSSRRKLEQFLAFQ